MYIFLYVVVGGGALMTFLLGLFLWACHRANMSEPQIWE
jgi:hypothetical protein